MSAVAVTQLLQRARTDGNPHAPPGRVDSATPTPTPAASPVAADSPAKASVVVNPTYKLSCLFLEDKDGFHYVVLRDDATGEQVRYFPTQQPGRRSDSAERYYREVWSPDGEYLVLPLNPFDGFCVIKAKGALKTIRQRRCDDFIRVLHYRPPMEVREVAYYHEWSGWETGTAFSFKAGLHGDRNEFVYDVARKELYDGEARRDEYLSYLKERVAKNDVRAVAETKRGRVEITRSFRKP